MPQVDRVADPTKRKRQHSSETSPFPNQEPYRSSKRRKVSYPSTRPASFWDRLTEVPLCSNALRELDRRNAKQSWSEGNRSAFRRSRRLAVAENNCRQQLGKSLACPSTSPDVKRLAKRGGVDVTGLRGYRALQPSEHEMSRSSLGRRKRGPQSEEKRESSKTTTTRGTGPYDRGFQQHLIDHNILSEGYEYPDGRVPSEPENLEEITSALAQPRASLSPSRFSNEDFRRFKRADTHATKESQVMSKVIPIIEGDIGDTKCAGSHVAFTNLDHLTDGTLVPAKPDLYYGARPEQLDRRVRQELDGYIIPSTQHDLPIVPNFFLEAKGPEGSPSVASRQVMFVAANGSRGMHSLQSHLNSEPEYDKKAYTLASTYYGGQLKIYASHPIPPSTPGEEPGYILTQAGAYAMTGSRESFRQGASAYRNGMDWAKAKRDAAIQRANKIVRANADHLAVSVASVASPADAVPASQDTVTNHGATTTPSSCHSDASAESPDVGPQGKRQRASASSMSRLSRSVSKEAISAPQL